MKVIGKELRKEYCGNTLVGYDTIHIIDQLPLVGEYIEVDKKKGYVVDTQYSEEDQCYLIYLEKNLGDWYNQVIEVCEVVRVDIKKKNE